MTSALPTLESGGEGLLDDRLFTGFFVLVAVLMVAGLVLFAYLLVRNLRLLRRGGPVPGGRQRPGQPLSHRLQELDDLHRRGMISDAEHSLARHRALTGG